MVLIIVLQFHYPPALLDVTAMNNWLNMFTSLLAMNVGEMEGEKETWPELPVWKVKKWCLKVHLQSFCHCVTLWVFIWLCISLALSVDLCVLYLPH